METNDTTPENPTRRRRNVRTTETLIKYMTRLPESTHTDLMALAASKGVSANTIIVNAVKRELARLAKSTVKA
jgi:predicted HicB family RNase H-like nuclease